jgi:hypothetical protein
MGSALRSPINKRYLAELMRAWVGRTDLFKKLKIFGVHPPTGELINININTNPLGFIQKYVNGVTLIPLLVKF